MADSKDKTDNPVDEQSSATTGLRPRAKLESAGENSSKADKNDDYETLRKEKQLTYFDDGVLHEKLIEDNKHLMQGGKRFGGVGKIVGELVGWLLAKQKDSERQLKFLIKPSISRSMVLKRMPKKPLTHTVTRCQIKLGLTKNNGGETLKIQSVVLELFFLLIKVENRVRLSHSHGR